MFPSPALDDAADMRKRSTTRRPAGAFARLRTQHRQALARLDSFEPALRHARRHVLDERPFRAVARYLTGPFAVHLAAEDGVLYPALTRQLPELALTLEPLRAEHAELHDMTRGLVEFLARPRTAARDEQLVVLGRDLTDLLRLHMRKEERSVLDWSEQALPAVVKGELRLRIAGILSPPRPRKGVRP